MKAARLHAVKDHRVEPVSDPICGNGQVVVRVLASGICGSDLPRILKTGTYSFPRICGHEFAGDVQAVGQDVKHVKTGQRVSVIPLIPCGQCRYCQARMPFHCRQYDFLGSRSDGGFAQLCLAPASNVVPVGADIPAESLAMTEPIAVAAHGVRAAGIQAGQTVLVMGAGAIGIFVAQWAKLAGAARVIVADVRSPALAVARACGLEGLDVARTPASKAIAEATDGLGADVVVEAAGAASATTAAFDCARRKGTVALIGRIDADYTLPGPTLTDILRKELRVQGVWGFDHWAFPRSDWQMAVDALAAGKIAVTPLITHRFSLDRINEAIAMMASGKEYYCKVLVMPQEPT